MKKSLLLAEVAYLNFEAITNLMNKYLYSYNITILYISVSQTVVRGPQVILGFCPCGPFRLNISPKKTAKIKLT